MVEQIGYNILFRWFLDLQPSDRVWTPGCAYASPGGVARHIDGRRPKLTHMKALIQTTIFDERPYDTGLRGAMRKVIDEFTLTYPGIKNVEREYFYAVHGADDATRQGYLERAACAGPRVLRRPTIRSKTMGGTSATETAGWLPFIATS